MRKNIHTNIMLDLECTGILPNPCLLQIGAVHFDIDTGEEYSHFCTPVSLKSCEDVNLQSTQDTMEWLLKHSPQVLEASEKSEVTIFQALFRFNIFVREAIRSTRHRLEESGRLYASDISEPMIWGNGAVADNIWIDSAYAACGMSDRKPWTFKNDMCVRTLVRTASDILGRNFAREERFQGTRHDALDDCRHQIRYMVKARNAMIGLSEKSKPASGRPMTLPIREKKGVELMDADVEDVSMGFTALDLGGSAKDISTNEHPTLSSKAGETVDKMSLQPPTTTGSTGAHETPSYTGADQKLNRRPDGLISSTPESLPSTTKKETVAVTLHRSDAQSSLSSSPWMCCQCGPGPFQQPRDVQLASSHLAIGPLPRMLHSIQGEHVPTAIDTYL